MFEWRRLVRGKIKIQVLAPLPRSLSRCLTTTLCLAASDQVSAWLLSLSRSVCLPFFLPIRSVLLTAKEGGCVKSSCRESNPRKCQPTNHWNKERVSAHLCVCVWDWLCLWVHEKLHVCVCVCCMSFPSFQFSTCLILFTWMHKTLSLTVLQSMAGISKSPVVLFKTGQL